MHKTIKLAIASAALVSVFAAGSALAAANPSGTGQPNQNCEALSAAPPGFSTAGFAHAKTVYAGAGASLEHANSTHAVSEYDVACFQLSSH